MNIKQAAASIVALTILAGGPAIALAGTTFSSDPIVVSNVNVQPNDETDGSGPGFVSMDFQNTSNMNATEIIFELDVDGARVSRYKDSGSFAPGITVRHSFLNSSSSANAQLNVVKVKFADGSVWAPSFAPSTEDE
jgi:hypothetical protein